MALAMILCAGFMGITFTQSGFDKLINYKGNRDYFQSQFSKSPLAKFTGALLPVIMLLEIASGLLCLSGIVFYFLNVFVFTIEAGLCLSALTLLFLLFGQRMAKDYAGAASIPGYFLVAIAGLVACGFVIR